MEWNKCPMYDQCQNIGKELVNKETCDFRWSIIGKCVEDNNSLSSKLNNLQKDIEFIHETEKTFAEFVKSIGQRTGAIEKNIEKIITRNKVSDDRRKIADARKKRKQHIRDTIVTGVVIAFIIGTLAGGWALFKKVSIILEKTQTITQPYQYPITKERVPTIIPKIQVTPQAHYDPHIHK